MSVRAKFRVENKKEIFSGGQKVYSVELVPVVGGSPENDSFYKWTPGGKIELTTISEGAASGLEVGKEYYVDFVEA